MTHTGAPVRGDAIRWTPFSDDEPGEAVHDEDELVDALTEAQAHRELAQAAIHALHDVAVQHDLLRASHRRVSDDYRRLRESILKASP